MAVILRPRPLPVEKIVLVHERAPSPPPAPVTLPKHAEPEQQVASSVAEAAESPWPVRRGLTETEQVIRWGADVLPEPPAVLAPPQPTMEGLLGDPAKAPPRSQSLSIEDLLKFGGR